MVGSRTATAVVGVVVSLLISAAAWLYFETFLLFLLVPFVPFLFSGRRGETRRAAVRTCPRCGFTTRRPDFEYCPRDGRRLE